MKKVIFAVLAILVVAGGAGAYWYGNQPKLTYYPSGAVKSSVEQKMFKENGEYKVFNEDGTLAQKYTVVDGVKVGAGFIYAGAVTAEVNFADGALSGPLKLDTKGKKPEIDNLKINVAGGKLTAETKITEDEEAQNVAVEAQIACDEGEFLDGMQAFLSEQNINTFKNFGRCLSLTGAKLEDTLYGCKYKGAYQYPKFTAESSLECALSEVGKQMASAFADGAEGVDTFKTTLRYSPSERNFSIRLADAKGMYDAFQTFKGGEEIISAATEFAFSEQTNQDKVKLASDVLKNLIISDNQSAINGKVVSAVKGEFNFINGFSDPWIFSYYGAENTLTSQIKITDNSVIANLIYPISQEHFLSHKIQIDETFKAKYKSLVETVLKEFSENPEDKAFENLMKKWPEYTMEFSDVVKSVNFVLMNNKKERIVGAYLTVKKNVDFDTIADDIFKAFDISIVSYQNNKPHHAISGDVVNGFVADGKVISADEILNYLDTEAIDKAMKQAEEEYAQVSKMSQNSDTPVDPLFEIISEWYHGGMNNNTAIGDSADDVVEVESDGVLEISESQPDAPTVVTEIETAM